MNSVIGIIVERLEKVGYGAMCFNVKHRQIIIRDVFYCEDAICVNGQKEVVDHPGYKKWWHETCEELVRREHVDVLKQVVNSLEEWR